MAFKGSRVRLPSPPSEVRMNKDNSSSDSKFSGKIDPEIADLMGFDEPGPEAVEMPQFDDLFEDGSSEEAAGLEDVDITIRTFKRPECIEGPPKPFFQDKEYYKKVLLGEGEVSKKIHSYFSSFMTTQDPQERSVFRDGWSQPFGSFWGTWPLK